MRIDELNCIGELKKYCNIDQQKEFDSLFRRATELCQLPYDPSNEEKDWSPDIISDRYEHSIFGWIAEMIVLLVVFPKYATCSNFAITKYDQFERGIDLFCDVTVQVKSGILQFSGGQITIEVGPIKNCEADVVVFVTLMHNIIICDRVKLQQYITANSNNIRHVTDAKGIKHHKLSIEYDDLCNFSVFKTVPNCLRFRRSSFN